MLQRQLKTNALVLTHRSESGRASQDVKRLPFVGIGLLLVFGLLSACENTLVYSERSSFKLGLGVNDDPATPVNVQAGLKRTVIAFVPPRETDDDNSAGGEAASLLAGFKLQYDGSPANILDGELSIRTQFASGIAAQTIASNAAATALVVSVPVVRPASPDLQSRRVEAAQFVKSLDPAERDQLATALGESSEPDALGAILVRISQADRPSEFRIIAQQIQVLFDREF